MRPSDPAASTVPSGSNVAVKSCRPEVSDPVSVHVSVAASYTSALASEGTEPATSTVPSVSSVAVWNVRARSMLAAGVQEPVAGS